jgi:pimeloyl-ACP methyl ester carboxylesterase
VHHSSYADVASRISDYGIPVAVASLEPLRLAHKKLGGGMDDVRRLIRLAGEELVMHYKRLHLDEKVVIEWALGGHSMGGYNALQLAEVLQASNGQVNSVSLKNGSISRLGAKIVAWAAGTNAQSFPDLRDATLLRVLILLAFNDSIASISSPQQKQQLLSKLPKRTRLIKINGGNHSGFASYDDASKKSGTMSANGPRHISLELQQKEASRLTASFLLHK